MACCPTSLYHLASGKRKALFNDTVVQAPKSLSKKYHVNILQHNNARCTVVMLYAR